VAVVCALPLLPLLLAAALALFPPSPVQAHGPSAEPAKNAPGRAVAEQLTVQLAALHAQRLVASPDQQHGLEASMRQVAQNRKLALLALVESDPAEFLRIALPEKVRLGLPSSVQALVEQEVDIEGTLEVLHEDGANYHRYHYHLETAMGRLRLHFAQDPPDTVLTGARVRVRGKKLDNEMAAGSGTKNVQTVSAALPSALGPQHTLVILVNFQDKATQPYTLEHARNVTFGTTSNFDVENSYGQTWLTGDVVGWFTIPVSSTVCDYNAIRTYGRQAAAAAGVNVSGYARHVFAFPANACSWWGLGTVGGNPSSAWVKGTYSLGVIGHELGHNLGLYHSHSYDCGTTVLGTTCTIGEYGDSLDLMGASQTAHFNAFQKERLGWLGYGASPPITSVSASGTYTVAPYEPRDSRVKALKILKGTDSMGRKTYYYVEYRQGIGFDAFVASNANVRAGIVIHMGTESSGDSSYLLDMTPATSSWADPALGLGQTFADVDAGITISPLWADSTGAGVSVVYTGPACVPAPPTVAMTPSAAQWATAGTAVAFTVSVTNNDNVGCTTSTFAVTPTLPAGWTVTMASSVIAVNPGATSSTTMTVSSPAATAEGFYAVVATVADGAGRSGSASGTYVVAAGVDASVTTDKTTYSRGDVVSMTTVVRMNGAAVSGAAVTVSLTKANGGVVTMTATTSADGRAIVRLRLKKQDPVGTYQVLARTTQGSLTGQAATSFRVD
jgi:hypothetical protein